MTDTWDPESAAEAIVQHATDGAEWIGVVGRARMLTMVREEVAKRWPHGVSFHVGATILQAQDGPRQATVRWHHSTTAAETLRGCRYDRVVQVLPPDAPDFPTWAKIADVVAILRMDAEYRAASMSTEVEGS